MPPTPGVDQTPTTVRALTAAGWITGTLQLPAQSTLVDYLNRAHGLVRMADVRLEGHDQRLPFLGVRRDSMEVVVPPDGDASSLKFPQGTEEHDVAGVLATTLFSGTVHLAHGMRVSDFFAANQGWIPVSDAELYFTAQGGRKQEQVPVALIHAPSIIAVSDTLG